MKLKVFFNLIILLVFILSFICFSAEESFANNKSRKLKLIEAKSRDIRKKIEETREKEKVAVTKLTAIQRELSQTQNKLSKNKEKLSVTQDDLNSTEKKLVELKQDYSILRADAEERIRQIYQGQRLRMLEILLRTPNLTDLLDVLYYQKLLVVQDKDSLEKLSKQSVEISNFKERLAEKKIEIAGIVGVIEGQKRKIARQHADQSQLVKRLRTERSVYEQAERQLERDSEQLIEEINRLVEKGSFSGHALLGTGNFSYPIRGRLTSPFGMRRHPIFGVVSFHSGIDLAAPNRTPIKASDNGRVILSGWYGGYGKVVIVDHGKNYSTLYGHLSSTSVGRGKNVIKGQVIGHEGQTGYSTGPHLHFEVRKNGKPQNPLNYLR